MKRRKKRTGIFPFLPGIFHSLFAALLTACSFDYGSLEDTDKSKPDIVMEDLEYVRVRNNDPLVRIQAEHGERWEEYQIMELRDFSFEQLEERGETVNAAGSAGTAEVQLDSGNITLKDGVRINIESEDIVISTGALEWKDREKILSGGAEAPVDVERSDGTGFSGTGFSADLRSRTWNFSGEVSGVYVEDEEETAETAGGQTPENAAPPAPLPETGE